MPPLWPKRASPRTLVCVDAGLRPRSGHSLAEISTRTGTTVGVVRRVVGKLDRPAMRLRQEEVARRINAEALAWSEKVARWQAETGLSEATFWRALQRDAGPGGEA